MTTVETHPESPTSCPGMSFVIKAATPKFRTATPLYATKLSANEFMSSII